MRRSDERERENEEREWKRGGNASNRRRKEWTMLFCRLNRANRPSIVGSGLYANGMDGETRRVVKFASR